MRQETTATVVRIIVSGRTYRYGQMDNRDEARGMLLDALASSRWPARITNFAVTPGGFVRTQLPRDYAGRRGWKTRKSDFLSLIPYAEEAVRSVICGDVLDLVRDRARFLTLGVDLNVKRHKDERIREDHSCRPACPRACTHAELVAVFDTAAASVILWTGKSYPTNSQQHTLVHQTNLSSHFLVAGSERVLVLGCHDLHLFSKRGRPSVGDPTNKEIRCQRMCVLAEEFKPTMILHHPHSTYSPRVWQGAWGATLKTLPSVQIWASGLAFYGNPKPKQEWKPWQTLKDTRSATSSGFGIFDVVTNGCD